MNVRLQPLTASLLSLMTAACAGGPARRVETSGVPLEGISVGIPADASIRRPPSDASPSGLDHRFQRRLRDELSEQLATAGRPALELIEPGTAVDSRLRFAMSRLLLDRLPEAEVALAALVRDVPDCALGFVLLGQLRRRQGNGTGAVEALLRAQAIERQRQVAPHPDLGIELAMSTLLAGDGDEGMRLLRAELASGANRARAAETLARIAAEAGEFEDALAALDAVLDDQPDLPVLVVAKVDVLVDQLRFDDAAALVDQAGGRLSAAERMHLRALVAWRRGELQAAVNLAREAIAALAGTPEERGSLGVELRRRLTVFETDLAHGGRRNATYRELLGRVRYSPREGERVAALRLLCERGSTLAEGALAAGAAVRWAMADSAVTLRAMVFRLNLARVPGRDEALAAGLRDPESTVRAAAAGAVLAWPAHAPALVEALSREGDPEAFLTMHRVLRELSGLGEFLPFGGERDPSSRADAAERWRRELAAIAEKRAKT